VREGDDELRGPAWRISCCVPTGAALSALLLIACLATASPAAANIGTGSSLSLLGKPGYRLGNPSASASKALRGSLGSTSASGIIPALAPDGELPPVVTGVTPREGSANGGTEVRITGLNLEEIDDVWIPPEGECEFSIKSPPNPGEELEVNKELSTATEIVAKTSAHSSGPVNVCVDTGHEESETSEDDRFTFGPTVTSVTSRGGPIGGGTLVTIKGRGFTGATAGEVKFGRTPAASEGFSVNAAGTEITARSPAHGAGTVDVTVATKALGESASSKALGESVSSAADHFTYGPGVEDVTPHGGNVTAGNSVTLTGVNFTGATEVDFGGTKVGCGASSPCQVRSDGEVTVTAPEHEPETVPVTVTTPEGTSEACHSCMGDLYAFGVPFVEEVQHGAGSIEGGTNVTIKGTNFDVNNESLTSIGIGGFSVNSFTVKSANEVTATTHPIEFNEFQVANNRPVSVANKFGANTQLPPATEFTYYVPTHVEKIEPDHGASGSGTRVKLLFLGPREEELMLRTSEVNFGTVSVPPLSVRRIGSAVRLTTYLVEAEAPPQPEGTVVDVTVTTPAGPSWISPSDRFTYGGHEEPESEKGFGVEEFEALTCGYEIQLIACSYRGPREDLFTQAAGLAPYFALNLPINARERYPGEVPGLRVPEGDLRHVRVDLPPGMAFNPNARGGAGKPGLHPCKFEPKEPAEDAEQIRRCGPSSEVGVVMAEIGFEKNLSTPPGVEFSAGEVRSFPLYELEPEEGVPAEMGFVATNTTEPPPKGTAVFIKGGLSSHREEEAEQKRGRFGEATGESNGLTTGNYHEYAEVEIPAFRVGEPERAVAFRFPVVVSKTVLNANAVSSGFITLPSECSSSLSYHIRAESYGSEYLRALPPGSRPETSETESTTPFGVTGCSNVPFKPEVSVTPGAKSPSESQPGQPDGATVTVKLPQGSDPDSADPHEVTVSLPEGMTVNPSQANSLEHEAGCSEEEFGVEPGPNGYPVTKAEEVNGHEVEAPITCKPRTKLGTFEVRSPDLEPPSSEEEAEGKRGQLRGSVYLARPLSSEPESGEEYRVFLAAESKRYGVGVRLLGHVKANKTTGRLSTTLQTPQLPFEESITRFDSEGEEIEVPKEGGAKGEEEKIKLSAPLANPLTCGSTESVFVPYGAPATPNATPSSPFSIAGCAPPPFNLGQQAAVSSTQAGEDPSFTLKWTRGPEQQYLIGTQTTLPPGLVGSLADVPVRCEEAQANAGACPAESYLGEVRSASGAGQPYVLGGSVYLTGPYDGAPYGLAIVVPAEHVGPYDYGKIVSRAKIEVNPETAQVTTTASVPAIVGGAPVRLREIEVTLNRKGFMRNPTNCSPLQIESTLSGTDSTNLANPPETAHDPLNTPFQATGCSALSFRPSFTSKTSAKTSRQDGASLSVRIAQRPGEANIHAVETQLPYALPSRLPTLQKACTEAQFAQNPAGCPAASFVGSAVAITPLLKAPLTGKAILVSHGGREFPDLKFLLEGEGIKVDLTGHTDIKKGITYSKFETVPDTPVTSFETTFPTGPFSLLGSNGSFCTETQKSTERVPLRNKHGRIVRRHGHVVYQTIGTLSRQVPASLFMPTTITGQNGVKVTQKTKIEVQGCPKFYSSPNVLSHQLKGNTLIVRLKSTAKGRLTISGKGLKSTRKSLSAGTHTLKIRLSKAGIRLARHHQQITVKLTLKVGKASSSSTLGVRL
jgi:IPT/TIG domain